MKRKPLKITAILLFFSLLECALYCCGCAAPGQTDITPPSPRRAADQLAEAPAPVIAATRRPAATVYRPVAAINTWNAHPDDPFGRHPRWVSGVIPDQMRWLDRQMQLALDAGFTEIALILPAGVERTHNADGRLTIMPGSQFHTLDPDKRAALAELIALKKSQRPELRIIVYQGFDLDPNPLDLDFREHVIPDFGNNAHRAAFAWQNAGWRSIGVDAICFDYASTSPRRAQFLLFSQWLEREYGLECLGEALPRTAPEYVDGLDGELIRRASWMALLGYHREWDASQSWRISADDQPQWVGLRLGDEPTDAEMRSLARRGFSPWVYNAQLYPRVARVWGFAP